LKEIRQVEARYARITPTEKALGPTCWAFTVDGTFTSLDCRL